MEKLWTGAPEARLIATRRGLPPQGSHTWTLRGWARKLVAWALVAAVSSATVRRTLKKTA